MNQNLVEIVAVIDRSGSTKNITGSLVEGFKEFISSQLVGPGDANISVYTFDDYVEPRLISLDLKNVKTLIDKSLDQWFAPRGMTALYDAIGHAIDETGNRLAAMPEKDRPAKVVVITMTDGQENMSRKYSLARLREMIQTQTKQFSWDFVFVGANQDAVLTAEAMGMSKMSAVTFDANEIHTRSVMSSVANYTTRARAYACASGVDIEPVLNAFTELEREAAVSSTP